jgi:cytochrome c oxidase subunit 2
MAAYSMRTGVSGQYSRETELNSYLDSGIAFSRRNEKSETWLFFLHSHPHLSSKGYDVNSLKTLLMALATLTALPVSTMAQDADNAAKPAGVHEIQVTLKKYEFNPGSIRVTKGEQVRLIMTAVDHDHGFKLDDFQINQKIRKGTTATVEFTADKTGTFQFRCSNVCGLGHRSMKGTLEIRE